MPLSRRRFLHRPATASAALLVPSGLQLLAAPMAGSADAKALKAVGYGPLRHDPAGLLELPEGFQYKALSTARLGSENDPRFTQKLGNGELVPGNHDGMAAFSGPAGITVLVRNHELEPDQQPAVDPSGKRRYDRLGTGGTTTLWVDGDRNLVRSFPSLAGTFRNCAGGPTPWRSWLSGEECVYMPGGTDDHANDRTAQASQRHGYVFEVDARAEGLVDPVPIKAMGRFRHEAVAADPHSGTVYMTEDRPDGLLYRYRPDVLTGGRKTVADLAPGDLALGGKLEALRITGHPSALTQNHEKRDFAVGAAWPVDWWRSRSRTRTSTACTTSEAPPRPGPRAWRSAPPSSPATKGSPTPRVRSTSAPPAAAASRPGRCGGWSSGPSGSRWWWSRTIASSWTAPTT
jgi:secreted PhoX family phosphatase